MELSGKSQVRDSDGLAVSISQPYQKCQTTKVGSPMRTCLDG